MDAIAKFSTAIENFSKKGFKTVVAFDFPSIAMMAGGIIVAGVAIILFYRALPAR